MKNISLFLCIYNIFCFRIAETDLYFNYLSFFLYTYYLLFILMYIVFFKYKQYNNIIILSTIILQTISYWYGCYAIETKLNIDVYKFNFFILNTLPFLLVIDNEMNNK